MDTKPYAQTEPESSTVAEPAVAYQRTTPQSYTDDPTLFYGRPAPRTKEEMDRWVARQEATYAAGIFYTAEESHNRIKQRLAKMRCK